MTVPTGVQGALRSAREIRRAVVTGGAGFLGAHLCEHLLDRGVEVVCLDNFLTGSPENVLHLMEHPGFRLVRCDVTDYVHVPGPVDLVLHFASPASPLDYLKMPIETLKVGSLGTLHTLGLAKEKSARYLLASTSGVDDDAKRFSEPPTTASRPSQGTDTAIVRIFNTYGPRMRPDDGRAIPAFVQQALAGLPLTVAGDGLQTRSVCYVDDTIRGILAVAASTMNGPVNIGNPDEMTVLEIAQRIIRATN